MVVSKVPAEEAGVTPGEQYEWDEVWHSWPDIDDENGTLDIGTIAYFSGGVHPLSVNWAEMCPNMVAFCGRSMQQVNRGLP